MNFQRIERHTDFINCQQINNTEKEETTEITIDYLTDDDLIKIFSYLTISDRLIIEEVCRRWFRVSTGGWYDIKSLCLKYPEFNFIQVKKIIERCGKFLVRFTTPINSVTNCHLKFIAEHCSHLKKLTLNFDPWAFRPVLQDYSKRFAKSLPQLQQLESLLMYEVNSILTAQELNVFSMINLKRLKISGIPSTKICSYLSANISKFCYLQRLSINYMKIQKMGLISFERFDNLIELNVSYCAIPEIGIQEIEKLKQLQVLQLAQGPTNINDRQICEIVTSCVNLKYLRLDGIKNLTDNCFKHIAQLKQLEVLHMNRLRQVTDRSIVILKQLYLLSCDECPKISAAGIMILIANSPKLTQISCRRTPADIDEVRQFLEVVNRRKHGCKMTLDLDSVDETAPIPKNSLFI